MSTVNRFTERGTATPAEERTLGALPFAVETLDQQVARCIEQVRSKASSLDRWLYLNDIASREQRLFYATLLTHTEELMPIVYTPTVGEVCTKYSEIWTYPNGIYLNRHHKGQIEQILRAYAQTHPDVEVSVVTDGSRILGLGDLGFNGHGICVGKLSLYTVTAGVNPAKTLPVSLDVGCNVSEIRDHPNYLGVREPRIDGEEYYALVDEFVTAFNKVFPKAVLQFEDFSNNHAFDLLEKHRSRGFAVFNDDIQGTGCVAAAAAATAFRAMGRLGMSADPREQRYVFLGAGAGGVGVADSLATLSVQAGSTMEQARSQIYLVDSRGLIHAKRADYVEGKMAGHKLAYAKAHADVEDCKSLIEVIEAVKPTVLVGLSTIGKAFNREVVEAVCKHCEHPLIMALSNPTPKAECTSTECHEFSKGKAFYASGSPMAEIPAHDGKGTITPAQSNNSYVFGAIGVGSLIGQCTSISDTMIAEVANAVAKQTPEAYLAKGILLPPLSDIRNISANAAVALIKQAWKEGIAQLPKCSDEEVLAKVLAYQYWPAQI